MSAPLLRWVVLLHWATGGGFGREGRTWQHCTGRSRDRGGLRGETGDGCARRHAGPCSPAGRMLPTLPGQTPKACFVLGGAAWRPQGAQTQGLSARGPADASAMPPCCSCQHPWAAGLGVTPVSAAPWCGTGPASNRPFSVPWEELRARPCGASTVPRSGGPTCGEGKDWQENSRRAMKSPPWKVPPIPDSLGLPALCQTQPTPSWQQNSREVSILPPPAEELAAPTAFPVGKCQEPPQPKKVPVPHLCPLVLVLGGPCMGGKTSAQFLGLFGPGFRVLRAWLGVMAPVFPFYCSPGSCEKERWERWESFCPPPPPRGAPNVPAVPKQPRLDGPRGVKAPAWTHLTPCPASLPVAARHLRCPTWDLGICVWF